MTSKEIYNHLLELIPFTGTCYYKLDNFDGVIYALVFCCETNTDEVVIRGKVAYNDSFLTCDYDCDWLMPVFNNEVFDTDITIDNYNDIDWLINQYHNYIKGGC